MSWLTLAVVYVFICGVIGTKEWFDGDMKQEDGFHRMYAYSGTSNTILVMVRGEREVEGRERRREGEDMDLSGRKSSVMVISSKNMERMHAAIAVIR